MISNKILFGTFGCLALVTAITMSAASCQSRLLYAGSAEMRLKLKDAIAADNLQVAKTASSLVEVASKRIGVLEATLDTNSELYKMERDELAAQIDAALKADSNWQCPEKEEWLKLASCPAPL